MILSDSGYEVEDWPLKFRRGDLLDLKDILMNSPSKSNLYVSIRLHGFELTIVSISNQSGSLIFNVYFGQLISKEIKNKIKKDIIDVLPNENINFS